MQNAARFSKNVLLGCCNCNGPRCFCICPLGGVVPWFDLPPERASGTPLIGLGIKPWTAVYLFLFSSGLVFFHLHLYVFYCIII